MNMKLPRKIRHRRVEGLRGQEHSICKFDLAAGDICALLPGSSARDEVPMVATGDLEEAKTIVRQRGDGHHRLSSQSH